MSSNRNSLTNTQKIAMNEASVNQKLIVKELGREFDIANVTTRSNWKGTFRTITVTDRVESDTAHVIGTTAILRWKLVKRWMPENPEAWKLTHATDAKRDFLFGF